MRAQAMQIGCHRKVSPLPARIGAVSPASALNVQWPAVYLHILQSVFFEVANGDALAFSCLFGPPAAGWRSGRMGSLGRFRGGRGPQSMGMASGGRPTISGPGTVCRAGPGGRMESGGEGRRYRYRIAGTATPCPPRSGVAGVQPGLGLVHHSVASEGC